MKFIFFFIVFSDPLSTLVGITAFGYSILKIYREILEIKKLEKEEKNSNAWFDANHNRYWQ